MVPCKEVRFFYISVILFSIRSNDKSDPIFSYPLQVCLRSSHSLLQSSLIINIFGIHQITVQNLGFFSDFHEKVKNIHFFEIFFARQLLIRSSSNFEGLLSFVRLIVSQVFGSIRAMGEGEDDWQHVTKNRWHPVWSWMQTRGWTKLTPNLVTTKLNLVTTKFSTKMRFFKTYFSWPTKISFKT